MPNTRRLPDLPSWAPSLPAVLLALLSLGYRLPVIVNAPGGVNADASVVGLQAMHILRGEWSATLWASDYQSSADAVIAAFGFLLIGSKPLALVLSTVVDHTVLTLAAFATLRRRFAAWPALLLSLPLVFTPEPVHTNVLHPPRQAALTLVFVAVWLLDGAPSGRRPALWLGLGALSVGLACFADPIALVFLPALVLFVAFVVRSVPRELQRRAVFSGAAGALVGFVPYFALIHSNSGATRVLRLSAEVAGRNLRLAYEHCVPFALSARVYYSPNHETSVPWVPPLGFGVVQTVGAMVLVGGMIVGGFAAFDRRRAPAERRLGAFGGVVLLCTLGGFLLSPMVSNLFSARYLAPLILAVPLAFAPLLARLGARRMAALLAPYLASAAVAGWLEFGSDVEGWRIRRDNARAVDERALLATLAARGIRQAYADYWAAYRLTFIYEEEVIVVPLHESQDRYRPYRDAVAAASQVAYIYDPWRSDEDFDWHEAQIRSGATEWETRPERLEVGRFSLLILTKKAQRPRIANPTEPPANPAPGSGPSSGTQAQRANEPPSSTAPQRGG